MLSILDETCDVKSSLSNQVELNPPGYAYETWIFLDVDCDRAVTFTSESPLELTREIPMFLCEVSDNLTTVSTLGCVCEFPAESLACMVKKVGDEAVIMVRPLPTATLLAEHTTPGATCKTPRAGRGVCFKRKSREVTIG